MLTMVFTEDLKQVRMTWFTVCDPGSLVGLCMQDYKSLCVTVTISATLVNIQTDRKTDSILTSL